MKIGIFLQDLKSGGAEKMMVEYANFLCENTNDEVYLILVRNEGVYFNIINPKINLLYLDTKKTLYSFYALYKAIKKNNIEYLYSTLVNANILALLVCKLLNVKVIIREANTIVQDRIYEKRKLIRIANSLSKYMYSWTYKCIAISESVKQDLIEHTNCPSEKIKVIYNPIIIVDNIEAEINPEYFHVCLVSRLTAQKNIKTVCNIIEKILPINKKIQFHFFGQGDDTKLKGIINKYHADKNIILHNFELSYYSYVKKMNLFLHIPIWEGLGNSVLEVFNSGIPMILSNVKSGYSELIDENNPNIHYVDPYDEQKIIELIQSYYFNEITKISFRPTLTIQKNDIYASYRELAI